MRTLQLTGKETIFLPGFDELLQSHVIYVHGASPNTPISNKKQDWMSNFCEMVSTKSDDNDTKHGQNQKVKTTTKNNTLTHIDAASNILAEARYVKN